MSSQYIDILSVLYCINFAKVSQSLQNTSHFSGFFTERTKFAFSLLKSLNRWNNLVKYKFFSVLITPMILTDDWWKTVAMRFNFNGVPVLLISNYLHTFRRFSNKRTKLVYLVPHPPVLWCFFHLVLYFRLKDRICFASTIWQKHHFGSVLDFAACFILLWLICGAHLVKFHEVWRMQHIYIVVIIYSSLWLVGGSSWSEIVFLMKTSSIH